MTSEHRYPMATLIKDYARAGGGVAVCGLPLALTDPTPWVGYVLLPLTVMFAAFGARTALRQLTVIEVSPEGIRSVGPWGIRVGWSELRAVGLRYYSTRRDREKGWMNLKVRGAGRALLIDSAIQGFDIIARRAAEEAARRRLPVGPASLANFRALGIDAV